ncbi:hypothetical protein O6H91_02G091600 [Diphasiastrum complanatum]|uniref:Uncharacterized protein n=1 Tax=Diphasiastrum complanatum TaxID=34168 RepID=A0ACC2EIG7_DIPCM|nr:hypothetical protein O6H91_02G091600 [Diphasiastrum complanatum]
MAAGMRVAAVYCLLHNSFYFSLITDKKRQWVASYLRKSKCERPKIQKEIKSGGDKSHGSREVCNYYCIEEQKLEQPMLDRVLQVAPHGSWCCHCTMFFMFSFGRKGVARGRMN